MPEVYPLFYYSLSIEPPDSPPDEYFIELKYDPAWRGFAVVLDDSAERHPIDELLPVLRKCIEFSTFDPAAATKPHTLRINGEDVWPEIRIETERVTPLHRIEPPTKTCTYLTPPTYVFDRETKTYFVQNSAY